MRLVDGLALQDGCTERTRERVAGSHRVGHLHLRRGLIIRLVGREHIAAVGAAGQHQNIQVVLLDELLAALLLVEVGQSEHTAHHHQLLVVDFQYVAAAHRGLYDFLGEEALAQVDVENLHAVGRCGIQELSDGLTAHHAALCQRAEAYGLASLGHLFYLRGERDVVPCHALAYVVCRNTLLVERHLHRSRGIRDARHQVVQPVLFQCGNRLFAQCILTQRTHGKGVETELSGMICEVGRCATQFLSFGQAVP